MVQRAGGGGERTGGGGGGGGGPPGGRGGGGGCAGGEMQNVHASQSHVCRPQCCGLYSSRHHSSQRAPIALSATTPRLAEAPAPHGGGGGRGGDGGGGLGGRGGGGRDGDGGRGDGGGTMARQYGHIWQSQSRQWSSCSILRHQVPQPCESKCEAGWRRVHCEERSDSTTSIASSGECAYAVFAEAG